MKKLALVFIILLAFILRFYNLGSYPAFNADEAAIGYNALSLLETGKDEHGNSWPVHFQSFNDFKPGLYFYLVLPIVKVFGLSEWSVRIPNAFLGVLTVYVLYLLIKVLKIKSSLELGTWKLEIEEIAAFMLAISPWHIHFSRGAWEVNTATFLIILGTFLFLKFINNTSDSNRIDGKGNPVILFLCAISFALSFYTYHSARVIVPLLAFGFLGIYFNELKRNIGSIILTLLLFVVSLLPLAKDFTKTDISSRAAGVGLWADLGPINRVNEQRGDHIKVDGIFTKLIHNKAVNYSLTFLKNWGSHYHGLFLFLSGDDIQRNKVPETGQMYMSDFLWIMAGLFWMAKNINKSTRLILHWLLIAPFAASLTFQSPHALRSQNMVIPLVIIAAIGFIQIWNWLSVRNRYLVAIGHWILVILAAWQFTRYEHMYWIHMTKEYPFSSQYGVKELVSYLSQNQKDYDKIVITTRYDQPYILFLFYNSMMNPTEYSPGKFQAEHNLTPRDRYGFSTVDGYDKFLFKNINLKEDSMNYRNSLIIGTPEEISGDSKVVKKIYGSNGYEYFNVIEN